jgi:hypothetical protein
MEGTVDLRAGGVTYFNASDPSAKPAEWATQGRYDVGLERVKEKQTHIEEAFSVPLFQLFTQQESAAPNRMTATEVNARNAERLAQFSPTFARLTTELLIPLLQRVYGILARRGAFPPPPQELIQTDAKGEMFIPVPNVVFNSRIALAVRSMELAASERTLQRAIGVATALQDTSIIDNFDLDAIVRDGALTEGMDAELLRPADQVAQMREGRAQAAQQQANMQHGMALAQMAQKAGSVPADSPFAQQMSEDAA